MNKDNAKEFLPLVQALADGRTIQHKSTVSNAWTDVVQVSFNLNPDRYRIKPERIKKKMWYHPTSAVGGLYPVDQTGVPSADWERQGWKIIEIEYDLP